MHHTHYFMVSQGVRKEIGDFIGAPRFSPDGGRLVGQQAIAGGGLGPLAIYDYDLAGGAATRLTNLVSSEGDRWYVQEAHLLPNGQGIIFYGNHTSQVGASGNGLIWWSIPLDGGAEQRFSEGWGNGLEQLAFQPGGASMAYSVRSHLSACLSVGDLLVRDTHVGGDSSRGLRSPLVDNSGASETYPRIRGLSWAPDGNSLAFGLAQLHCTEAGPQTGTPGVYLWQPFGDAPAQRLADGQYPVWVAP